MALTRRQRQVFDYISGFIETNGYSPSYEEIGAAMGLTSLATVHKHVTNLRRKKLIETEYNQSRSISVANKCPTCGRGPSSPPKELLRQSQALGAIS